MIPLIIQAALIALKLFDLVSFSWFWVLAPIWGPAFFGLSSFIIACIAIYGKEKQRKKVL